jgi:hypothetical protein
MVSSNEDASRNNAASDPNRDVPQVIKASGQIQIPDDDELGAMLERRDLIKAGAVVGPNTRDA